MCQKYNVYRMKKSNLTSIHSLYLKFHQAKRYILYFLIYIYIYWKNIIVLHIYTHNHQLIIGIPEVFKKLGYVIAKHIINSLYQFWLQLLKLVDAVAAQDFSEVLDIWKIPSRQMKFSLNLFQNIKKKIQSNIFFIFYFSHLPGLWKIKNIWAKIVKNSIC